MGRVGFIALVALVVSAGTPAWADDSPRYGLSCSSRRNGDPCRSGSWCGVCRPTCENGGCLVCVDVHDCTVFDDVGCGCGNTTAPAAAALGGLVLAWLARRRSG